MRLLLHILFVFMLLFYSQLISAQLAAGQDKFLGNIYTGGQTPLNFDLYWNQVTPGNAGKWASCEQARDDFNYWLWLDRAYSHAKQNGFAFKEHTLVWGASSGEPTWMSSVDEDEQMDEVIEWYEAVAERYPDIDLIDVVNEPLHDAPSYTEALGGDGDTGWDWVIWCFEEAREVFPDAKLLLNEYNVLNYTSTCEDFLEIVKILQERDLIDGVGLQAHSLESIDISTIKANLDLVAATGIEVYISEYEARGDDSTQLALFKEQFPVFWENEAVKGVTLWGYLEGDMWRETAYLLEEDGVTERPALQWLREYFDSDTTETDCDFGTPLSTALPSVCTSYNYVHVLGTAGPDLSNVSNFTINWDLANNGLWQLSINTNDGNPEWWNNMLDDQTNTFSATEPTITFTNTGFDGLDGTYYVTTDDDNFVMAETSGLYTIYCSNSSDAPVCTTLKSVSFVQAALSNNAIDIFPNPASDILTIMLENADVIQRFKIYNSLGMVVQSQTNLNAETSYSINLTIPAGVYIISIETDHTIYTKQFVKK